MKPVAEAVRRARQVSGEERSRIAAFLHQHYDLPPVLGVRMMGSEADETLVIDGPSGPCAVLKVVGPAGMEATRLQVDLLEHLMGRPGVRVARVLRSREGASLVPVDLEGHEGTALMTTFCTGSALEDRPPSLDLVAHIAHSLAALQSALMSYPSTSAPVPGRHPWSLDAFPDHAGLIERHLEPATRDFALGVLARFRSFTTLVRPQLEIQALHADYNLSNVLTDGRGVTAVIDFGDTVAAPRVYDVAIALTYLTMQQPDLADSVARTFVTAYLEHSALGADELEALLASLR